MTHSVTFDAWRLCEGSARDTIPLDIEGDLTVDGAVNSALSCGVVLCHKDVLLIRQTDAGRGKAWLHCYAIKKKSNPTWRNIAVRCALVGSAESLTFVISSNRYRCSSWDRPPAPMSRPPHCADPSRGA